ncbi:MAG: hypothetical protein R2710_29205 [Acidimicrobiales bacterium]
MVERVRAGSANECRSACAAPICSVDSTTAFLALLTTDSPPEQLREIAERLRDEVVFLVEFDGSLISFTVRNESADHRKIQSCLRSLAASPPPVTQSHRDGDLLTLAATWIGRARCAVCPTDPHRSISASWPWPHRPLPMAFPPARR